ncbi:MAG: NAD(P)-binding domain-containing protein [Myxococcota bacterium]
MDYVLVAAGVAIFVVLVLTAVNIRHTRRAELAAERARTQMIERGALPPSLHPIVDLEACIGSGSCVEACPETDVLALIEGKAHLVNPTSCIGHGECRTACPVDAITLVIGTERRGIDIPMLQGDYQTNVPGLYIVGELGGMGLIYNAMTQALQCISSLRKTLPPPVGGAHQLVVVGAGPAGLAASVAAQEAGLDFVTLDQESLGGTVLHYPRRKLVMTRAVKLPGYGKIRVSTLEKEQLLEIWQDIVEVTGLQIQTGTTVTAVKKGVDEIFDIETSRGPLRAQRLILALGRRGTPRKLDVPGEELPKVVYRLQEPEAYAERSCAVIGGGDSAVEAAVSLGRAGATVHLVHRRKIFDRIKPANQGRLDEAVAAGQVEVLYEATVDHITPEHLVLNVGGQAMTLPNQDVFVLIGGVLPTAFLKAAGVEVEMYKGQAFAPANA